MSLAEMTDWVKEIFDFQAELNKLEKKAAEKANAKAKRK
jgi:hypothetical protein